MTVQNALSHRYLQLTMPSDFRWHSFLVSAGYLPDTFQTIKTIKNFPLLNSQIEPNQSHFIKQMPETRINTGFRHFCPLFKLAKSGLILIISVQLSIPFCIDNSYFFHTLFLVSHIFSTNPVPLLYCHYCV